MAILLKTFLLTLVAYFFVWDYYEVSFHKESSTGYLVYIVMLLVCYGVYKFISVLRKEKKLKFNSLKILGYAVLHIFILSLTFFGASSGYAKGGAFVLFFKIIGYSFLPFLITIIAYSFGKKILGFIDGFKKEEENFQFLTSLCFGFSSFLSVLCILSFLGFYNLFVLFGILIVFIGVSYKELIESFISLYTYNIEIDNHNPDGNTFDKINLYLISTEILFIFITFLVGVNLINIVRPMPIGWDDLGIYMNYPKMMGVSGEILKGVGMITWQIFTGIGFMFKSSTQAFFLNNLGGILSIITVATIIRGLFKTGTKKLINFSLLGVAIFYSMPMFIFQQAKDMKLDPALFFVTVTSIYSLIYLFLKYKKDEKLEKSFLYYLAVIGFLVGIAFSIKFTSLMLILGMIGVIFYRFLGIFGFFSFFSFFIGFFTKFKLWDYLNVVYPKDDINFINIVFYVCVALGMIFLFISFLKSRKFEDFKKGFIVLMIFSLGIFIGVSPWLAKNINEARNLSVGSILFGKGEILHQSAHEKIYSKEELKIIDEKDKSTSMTSSGKSLNEDLGRYFGYESGINNYLKLPYNLTLQKNQAGEYTDITFLYLFLIPVIFIFLPFRKNYLAGGILACLLFEYLYFKNNTTSKILTDFFSKQELPGGYLSILAFFVLFLLYFIFSLKNKNDKGEDDIVVNIFKYLLIFAFTYCFLFVISAFGIVWYGIAMYFIFILMILCGLYYLASGDNFDDNNKQDIFKLLGTTLVFTVFLFHIFGSSVPHGFNNLKNAGFETYKNGSLTQNQAIFSSHSDYFKVLAYLNLKDKKLLASLVNETQNDNLKKVLEKYVGDSYENLRARLNQIIEGDLSKTGLGEQDIIDLRIAARELLLKVQDKILYPNKDELNDKGIYRIGTFLTYFIVDNNKRYYEDSLIFNFDKYFYDKDPSITIDKMNRSGLNYLLVDLNAATIDKDPRHDLTRRFENLLGTLRSSKLELVHTDNMCLKLAIDEYKNGKIASVDKFIELAGVNYESYKDGESINRRTKQYNCLNYIYNLAKNNEVSDTKYSYLVPVLNYMKSKDLNNPNDNTDLLNVLEYIRGWYALFEIK